MLAGAVHSSVALVLAVASVHSWGCFSWGRLWSGCSGRADSGRAVSGRAVSGGAAFVGTVPGGTVPEGQLQLLLPLLDRLQRQHLQKTLVMVLLQENLKWEQRTVLQFNWVLVNRIMSPIQTALFMVQAWPSHCDCLALVNAVSAVKDELLVSSNLPFINCKKLLTRSYETLALAIHGV